jgi:xanthine dehydrogenase accessory factor
MNKVELQRPADSSPISVARNWLGTYDQVALATVVSTWGSAPVPVGGHLVVAPDGRFEGSVSGGCIEMDVISKAEDIMHDGQSKLLEFGIADEAAWRAGLPCGGTIKILVEMLSKADAPYLESILEARRARRPHVAAIDLQTGRRRIFEAELAEGEIRERIETGESGIFSFDEGDAFLQVRLPTVRVVIVGATHITQVLAPLAEQIGFDAIIIDPRTAFTSIERLGHTPTLTEWPEVGLAALGLDPRTAVVAVTHAAHLDDDALAAALRSDCLYIGALGSRKTHAKRLERLRAAGFSDADLERIHAPIGLAIGAKGPAEIALSILAEIVQVARRAEA